MRDTRDIVSIEPFKKDFGSELESLFHSNSEDTRILNCGLIYDALKFLGYLPSITRLVAYHLHNKTPIGFIALEETEKTLFSIQFLFVNPKYRKMGIGTRLLEEAIAVAKKKGALKLNLGVYPTKASTIELYKRHGFREIGKTLLVQGLLPRSSTSTLINRIILRQNGLKTEPLKNIFVASPMNTYAKKNCFKIFKKCMNDDWINFFQITPETLKHGSRNIWQPNFIKAFVSKDNDSFALLFNQPFPLVDIVELFSKPGVPLQPALEELLSILNNRGIGFTRFWIFGPTDDILVDWLKKKQMMIFNFICMGKFI